MTCADSYLQLAWTLHGWLEGAKNKKKRKRKLPSKLILRLLTLFVDKREVAPERNSAKLVRQTSFDVQR